MIRFILRAAFLLGLIAFFLPGGRNGESEPAVSYFQAFSGLQELMTDVGGFCGRAPTACSTAGQIAGFVADRVGDGLQFGYRSVMGDQAAPNAMPAAEPARAATAMQGLPPGAPMQEAQHPGMTGAAGIPAPSPRPPAEPNRPSQP